RRRTTSVVSAIADRLAGARSSASEADDRAHPLTGLISVGDPSSSGARRSPMSRFDYLMVFAKLAVCTAVGIGSMEDVQSGVMIDTWPHRICVRDNSERALHLYSVTPDCRVILDQLPATLGELEPGNCVTLTLTSNRSVRKIEAYTATGEPLPSA